MQRRSTQLPRLLVTLTTALLASLGCPQVITIDAPKDQVLPVPGPADERPAPSTRTARLTLVQWENVVQDLLRLDAPTGFSSELPQDAYPAGFLFDNPVEVLSVDPSQWAGFQRAAARVAELVTTDATLLARIAPPASDNLDARAAAFIADLGRRAQRRPLNDEDRAAYRTVFTAGSEAFPEQDAFAGGARLVIEALLQSPEFLYRIELSTAAEGELVPLDNFEIASRLSFSLWNTMPDDALLDAAEAGALADIDDIEGQVRRLLDDERATGTLLHVMGQLLETRKLDNVNPSLDFYPDAPVDLGNLARVEDERFLTALFDDGEGINELLTSTRTFVNEDTAAIYGVDGIVGDEFVEVELDPATRRGLFTHLAFLSINATSVDPDPIHRGVYLARHVSCFPLSAPPANIPPLPPPGENETNRQVVTRHTEQEGTNCAGCHTEIINPFGWPYEMYDSIGRLRTSDRGQPLDTASSVLLGLDTIPVRDAVELADVLAESPDVHRCFAQHFIESSLGRAVVPEDQPWIARLGVDSSGGSGIKDLIASLVLSRGFLLRSPESNDSLGGGQ